MITNHFQRTVLHCGIAGALLVTVQLLLTRHGSGLDELMTTPVAELLAEEPPPEEEEETEVDVALDEEPDQTPEEEPEEPEEPTTPEEGPDQPSPEDVAALLALLDLGASDLEQVLEQDGASALEQVLPDAPSEAPSADDEQAQVAAMLASGAALLDSGSGVPRLVASFLISDVEQLVERGLGIVIVDWAGTTYRVVPHGRSFLAAKDLVPLTGRSVEGFSNQTLLLNPPLTDPGQDRRLRRRFAPLEGTLRGRAGEGEGEGRPRFELLLGADLARHLHTKQLGALAHAGLADGDGDVETIGQLLVGARGPVFLVEAIRSAGRPLPFDDPQRALAARERR